MELHSIFAGLERDPALDVVRRDHVHGTTDRAEIGSAGDALRFMTAGNATVTLRSKKTGIRFTYRVRAADDKKVLFVSLLTGPDNETSYQYLGHIVVRNQVFFHGRKSRITSDAPGARAFAWAYRQLVGGVLPDSLEIWHEGKCGRCGRKLTVPESIATGFGPECAGKIGL